ncbi:tripartite tricarboxylate transporter permease [Schaalia sp. ZJ405]|uniref:tripartite tricarboxylate transporter permease n=1 Tax=Schaalia sp. ZJ405 TaxID=2709403 RepID=UPI0013EB6085|nr:tripartite tricarboxylate transporter permease [Schaalia sp. ZJ405]QPK81639.1 tripartite tricarboxylate transporter permease [Schaalia sp. ZJ405]
MDILTNILAGFGGVFSDPMILVGIAGGVFGGMIVGALPGLTATMAMALFLPFTFLMEPSLGIATMMGIFAGGIAGGSIPAILLNVPGTPASAATALDGYPMTRNGRASQSLTMAMIASCIGGTISGLLMVFLAPVIAKLALNFQAPEFFVLAIYGLTIISAVSGKSLLKGYAAGLIGLVIGIIGLDPISGQLRLTYGSNELYGGISLIPVLIGVFGLSQVLVMLKESTSLKEHVSIGKFQLPEKQDIKDSMPSILRGGLVGSAIGAIPGTGTDIGAFLSYSLAKQSGRGRIPFGKGNPVGVAASESANNGVVGGAMIPMFTLGIPGEAATAVLLGGLLIQGLTPGPQLFQGPNAHLVYTVFASFLIANIVMLLIGLVAARLFVNVVRIPNSYLIPLITILCLVGAYSINNRLFDVFVAIFFGCFGYLMVTHGYSPSPLILGMILGPMAETNFRRAMTIENGNWTVFFTRPASLIFWALIAASLFYLWRNQKKAQSVETLETQLTKKEVENV